jgi:hypothetical protein
MIKMWKFSIIRIQMFDVTCGATWTEWKNVEWVDNVL